MIIDNKLICAHAGMRVMQLSVVGCPSLSLLLLLFLLLLLLLLALVLTRLL